jgi:VanZ family protein
VVTAGRPRVWLHWVPAVVWAAVIFVLSAQSTLPAPPDGLSDKHSHALAFGLLALACLHGLVQGRWRDVGTGHAAGAALLAVAYGLSDEWHQAFVPGRMSDWADVVADATGAVVASGLGWAWAILLRRRAARRSPP